MSLQMDLVCVHKRRRGEEVGGYSSHKRVCKENDVLFQPLNECLMEYLDMQFSPPPECSPQKPFEKIFQMHESRGPVQPCLRCIAGESGHINHIASL